VVGGLAGGSQSQSDSRSSENLCSIDLVIRIDDPQFPLHYVNFWDFPSPGIPRDAPDVKELLGTANRFHALIKTVIEDTSASKLDGQIQDDLSGKLERLWELHQKGVLTRSEFDAQKSAILGGYALGR
jgi:hypothetical protein